MVIISGVPIFRIFMVDHYIEQDKEPVALSEFDLISKLAGGN